MRYHSLSDQQYFSGIEDPTITGPGVWFAIHNASKNLSFSCFIEMIYKLAEEFFCPHCQVHFKQYLANNPPENYRNHLVDINGKSLSIGAFLWGWQFHNAVNARLGKGLMSWESACALYKIG